MTEREKLLEKARKLMELKERGVGGEAENAEIMLERLFARHGVGLENLEDTATECHFVKFRDKHEETIIIQVFLKVIEYETPLYNGRKNGRKQNTVGTYLTKAQAVEVDMMADFYLKKYREDLELFVLSFISANDLSRTLPEDVEPQELTEEEIAKRRRAAIMAGGLDRHQLQRQLNGGDDHA